MYQHRLQGRQTRRVLPTRVQRCMACALQKGFDFNMKLFGLWKTEGMQTWKCNLIISDELSADVSWAPVNHTLVNEKHMVSMSFSFFSLRDTYMRK